MPRTSVDDQKQEALEFGRRLMWVREMNGRQPDQIGGRLWRRYQLYPLYRTRDADAVAASSEEFVSRFTHFPRLSAVGFSRWSRA